MSRHYTSPFNMLTPSSLPMMTSLNMGALLTSLCIWLKTTHYLSLMVSLITLMVVLFLWFKLILGESLHGGHTVTVITSLKLGMLLFIISEVFFFVSFFWAFFDTSFSPPIECGLSWAPLGTYPVNPYGVPLLNTAILLSSGVTVTWAHYNVVYNSKAHIQMMSTLVLGFLFTCLQVLEYKSASFTMSDGVFGSVFYVSTGFHGLHVLLGSVFLLICTIRLWLLHLNKTHHVGLELAIWYWHFVDVVWLFLYVFMYWWSF